MVTSAKTFFKDIRDFSDDFSGRFLVQNNEIASQSMAFPKFKNLNEICTLTSTSWYQSVVKRVSTALEASQTQNESSFLDSTAVECTYTLILESNRLITDIDNEIHIANNFNRDNYRQRFPELESLISHPVDYARVIQAIGDAADITQIDLDGVLPSSDIMVVIVTASTTVGKPLSETQLHYLLEGCDMVLHLDAEKSRILSLIENRMNIIAPNLSIALGPAITARLVGLVGGLKSLSKIPACNIQILGEKQKSLCHSSSSSVRSHQGLVFGSEIVQQTPVSYRDKASKLVSSKCALLARIDAYGKDPSGNKGRGFKEKMLATIERWQEPAPAKIAKPLPVPDCPKKKRRGGHRMRKLKERYGLTEVRKAANRVAFNQQEEEIIEGDEFFGLGLIGKVGNGRLRMNITKPKLKLNKNRQMKVQHFASIKTIPGLSSSLTFTPLQGIELSNPLSVKSKKKMDGMKSYFSEYSYFKSAVTS